MEQQSKTSKTINLTVNLNSRERQDYYVIRVGTRHGHNDRQSHRKSKNEIENMRSNFNRVPPFLSER